MFLLSYLFTKVASGVFNIKKKMANFDAPRNDNAVVACRAPNSKRTSKQKHDAGPVGSVHSKHVEAYFKMIGRGDK